MSIICAFDLETQWASISQRRVREVPEQTDIKDLFKREDKCHAARLSGDLTGHLSHFSRETKEIMSRNKPFRPAIETPGRYKGVSVLFL